MLDYLKPDNQAWQALHHKLLPDDEANDLLPGDNTTGKMDRMASLGGTAYTASTTGNAPYGYAGAVQSAAAVAVTAHVNLQQAINANKKQQLQQLIQTQLRQLLEELDEASRRNIADLIPLLVQRYQAEKAGILTEYGLPATVEIEVCEQSPLVVSTLALQAKAEEALQRYQARMRPHLAAFASQLGMDEAAQAELQQALADHAEQFVFADQNAQNNPPLTPSLSADDHRYLMADFDDTLATQSDDPSAPTTLTTEHHDCAFQYFTGQAAVFHHHANQIQPQTSRSLREVVEQFFSATMRLEMMRHAVEMAALAQVYQDTLKNSPEATITGNRQTARFTFDAQGNVVAADVQQETLSTRVPLPKRFPPGSKPMPSNRAHVEGAEQFRDELTNDTSAKGPFSQALERVKNPTPRDPSSTV